MPQTLFQLDARLAEESVLAAELPLCLALLRNDRAYPWLVLVPRRAGARELHDLSSADQALLMGEVTLAGRVLAGLFAPDKINTGALGNIVPQLHVHVVARTTGDPAWPGPVWGHAPRQPYGPEELEQRRANIGQALRQGMEEK
ncbi:MAG: HIT family protein [Deltaproteobacteria bacterium]|nr:HIT family protein [Deltaproteobacteria bacterium]